MFNVSSDHIFKVLLGILTAATLSGIGYLTVVVIKINNLEAKFEKQEGLVNDVRVFLIDKLENTAVVVTEQGEKTRWLEKKLEQKRAEAQHLESLLLPFQTIAHELFTGDEEVVLVKLADRIKTLEEKVRRFVYKPLSDDLRTLMVKQLSSLKQLYKRENISIELTHETATPLPTRKYASQLAVMMTEAGLNVTGPGFATVDYPDNKSYPLLWDYSKEQQELAGKLYAFLNEIQSCRTVAARKDFPKGRIRIHMAGSVVFDEQGKASFD